MITRTAGTAYRRNNLVSLSFTSVDIDRINQLTSLEIFCVQAWRISTVPVVLTKPETNRFGAPKRYLAIFLFFTYIFHSILTEQRDRISVIQRMEGGNIRYVHTVLISTWWPVDCNQKCWSASERSFVVQATSDMKQSL